MSHSSKPSWVSSVLPGLNRLSHYSPTWLQGDLLAGITVAAYLIPQCMAYGELAGVNPVAGLWAIMPPMIIYTLLGSSRQLSVGPESTTAVMTAATIAPLAASSGSSYAALAALLAGIMGLVCLIGYGTRLGFLADLLSKPILVGYMTGVAVIMIVGQLSKVSGIDIEAESILAEVWGFVSQLNQIHIPTLVLAGFVLVFLFAVQARFPTAPAPLLAVLLATAAVWMFDLDQQGVAVVGVISAALPSPALPLVSWQEVLNLVPAAVGITMVGYSDNVLTARAFAYRNHYTIDANQELLALGMSNLGAGLFQGFPISSSGSRTVIGDALGNKSQLFSLVALMVLLIVLLFLRPVLALFPITALGAIVIYAATKLIEISEFIRLKRFRSSEFVLALVTTVGVLATDLLVGVGIAVSLSVIEMVARISRPHSAIMGQVPDIPGLHDVADWPGATTIPGLVLYRYDAPLFFANVEAFKRRALAAIRRESTPVEWFVLNTEAIPEVDITAADMLSEFHDDLAAKGITFGLARVKQDLYAQLRGSQLLEKIGSDRVFFTLDSAIEAFRHR
ncbi:sodium-independent anion transporter [filamentous cyanobacterium CCP5]|nr:sodium-independent anion transporter [filamentous cyanobacterium CCP5]